MIMTSSLIKNIRYNVNKLKEQAPPAPPADPNAAPVAPPPAPAARWPAHCVNRKCREP